MSKCSRPYALRRRSAAACLKPCYRPACAFPDPAKRSDRLRCGRYSWTQPQTASVPSWHVPPTLSFTQSVLVWLIASWSAHMPRSCRVCSMYPCAAMSCVEWMELEQQFHRVCTVHSLLKAPEQLRPCLHVDALRSSSRRGRLHRGADEQSTSYLTACAVISAIIHHDASLDFVFIIPTMQRRLC